MLKINTRRLESSRLVRSIAPAVGARWGHIVCAITLRDLVVRWPTMVKREKPNRSTSRLESDGYDRGTLVTVWRYRGEGCLEARSVRVQGSYESSGTESRISYVSLRYRERQHDYYIYALLTWRVIAECYGIQL